MSLLAAPTNALGCERVADKRGFDRQSARWAGIHACAAQKLAATEARGWAGS